MINYEDAGVNIKEGYESVKYIKRQAERTYVNGVMNNIGSFAGMFKLGEYKKPILVSGTDGVGTKLDIAFRMKKYDTVGIDCVAMCVNDVLCHGAKPLFFLDYLACGKLEAKVASEMVKGVADGCIMADCALIGGETAEMPGFYRDGEYDMAGFCVGVVEEDKIIDGSTIEEGNVLIGISSSGAHSNGFSLIRKLIPNLNEELNGEKLGEVLLTPTKIYVPYILKLIEKFNIKGMAHITGGGFYENIPRMFKQDFTAVIDKNSFKILPIFKHLEVLGVLEDSLFNTFNMGIGFVLCVDKGITKEVISDLKEMGQDAYEIGYVKKGEKKVCIK